MNVCRVLVHPVFVWRSGKMFHSDDKEQAGMQEDIVRQMLMPFQTVTNQITGTQNYCAGYAKYLNNFLIPFIISTGYFKDAEMARSFQEPPLETLQAHMDLMTFNLDLVEQNFRASMRVSNEYLKQEMPRAMSAWMNTVFNLKGEKLADFTARQARLAELVTHTYPQAIRDIAPEYGFHFESSGYIRFAETDRYLLYQVLPTNKNKQVEVRENGKPVLIIPPFVLGANILAFLPNENRSYAHCFANQGIPTYIRIMKNIHENPAVQIMTAEDNVMDTRRFCEKIKARHGKPVTLNGYCQGGFSSLCNLLTGELDGLVDALITCVSPMDGTRSTGLVEFLKRLPDRFRNLDYGTKTLPNGNRVADGELMGWVYKLKSIEHEAPMVAFFRDMMMLAPRNGKPVKISSSAAAINYWLQNDRTDLPLAITRMSFASYTTPITPDGTLPVRIFNRELNIKRLAEKNIRWLICYGEQDDLVEPETALAPLDYVDAEVSAFPKGHVAIATSWSNPASACALHLRFGEKNYRGPVRFQLDLENELAELEDAPAPVPADAPVHEDE